MYGSITHINPNMGWSIILPMFAAAILGGIGNAYGAMAGGMIIGLSQEISTAFLPAEYKIAVSFVIMIAVLLFRPKGLMGGDNLLDYLISIMLTAGIYAIFALGLNLQWGYAGLLNFGHVAFMAIGAYATVLLSLNGVPLPLAILTGMILAGVAGAFLGMATLKLREDYLAIVTVGFSEILRFLLLNEAWLTKGSFGLYGYPRPFQDLVSSQDYNLFLAGVVLIILAIVYAFLEVLGQIALGQGSQIHQR